MASLDISEFKVKIERLSTWLESLKKQTGIKLMAHSDSASISHGLNISDKFLKNLELWTQES